MTPPFGYQSVRFGPLRLASCPPCFSTKGLYGRVRQGSARQGRGRDKADILDVRLRIAVRRLDEVDIDVDGCEGRRLGLHAVAVFASEPVECDGAIMRHEADLVIGVVGQDIPVRRPDDLTGLQAVFDRLHDLPGGHPDGFPLEVKDLSRYRTPEDVVRMLFDRLDTNMSADENLEGV